ncbi:MAG TPA: methyltransferase, partial [Myxococcota bacterium]|nr:methyltransferase [Myxococcota bacterium]
PRFATEIRTHARRVVTGPYRWVQHPGEIGLLAALTGVAAATGSVPAMAANVLVVAPLAVARMRREDRAWEQVPPG